MKTFTQLLRLGDAAADVVSKFAIRTRKFTKKTWADFIGLSHKINMLLFAARIDIAIGKYTDG